MAYKYGDTHDPEECIDICLNCKAKKCIGDCVKIRESRRIRRQRIQNDSTLKGKG